MRKVLLNSLISRSFTQATMIPCIQFNTKHLCCFHANNPHKYDHYTTLIEHQSNPHRKRSDIRAFSRRRNIFLDPAEKDDSITSLYDSSRFNVDDDDDDIDQSQSHKPTNDDDDNYETIDTASPTKRTKSHQNTTMNTDSDNNDASSTIKIPQPRNIRVKSAEFIKSSVKVEDCPPPIYPEFAVIGRSNVGKSSIINLLTGRNSLAMVSKTPGKTRCINHFLINNAWYLVDLPGYGYAKTSKENVLMWNKFTREYFLERETLVTVLLLVDASIPPMELDIACAAWLADAEIPFTLVYTKIDKRKKGIPPPQENIEAFETELRERYEELPPALATSSRTGAGKMELLTHIAQLRALYNAHQM